MKLKITPLTIAASFFLVYGIYDLLFNKQHDEYGLALLYKVLLLVLAVVLFVSDLIFRFSIKSIKRLWLVESLFIIFAILVILIIKR